MGLLTTKKTTTNQTTNLYQDSSRTNTITDSFNPNITQTLANVRNDSQVLNQNLTLTDAFKRTVDVRLAGVGNAAAPDIPWQDLLGLRDFFDKEEGLNYKFNPFATVPEFDFAALTKAGRATLGEAEGIISTNAAGSPAGGMSRAVIVAVIAVAAVLGLFLFLRK